MSRIAGIVLCGGRSRRMGQPKAELAVAGQTLLDRTIRTLAKVAAPIVVAAAPGQDLPSFSADVRVVRDCEAHGGPLTAFAQALSEIPPTCTSTYLLGCDLPFLTVEFLRFLAQRQTQEDAVVPFVCGIWHPLGALYRRQVQSAANRLVAAGRRRMLDLLAAISVTRVDGDELRLIDPELRCLRNVNTPEDYAAALRELNSRNTVNPP
jgi:molybdopterin-guanine dinucleotide biosynthesis protein A